MKRLIKRIPTGLPVWKMCPWKVLTSPWTTADLKVPHFALLSKSACYKQSFFESAWDPQSSSSSCRALISKIQLFFFVFSAITVWCEGQQLSVWESRRHPISPLQRRLWGSPSHQRLVSRSSHVNCLGILGLWLNFISIGSDPGDK